MCDDDVMYLRADLNEVCWQAGSRHAAYVLYLGIPMMLLYVIGLPVSTWYRMWRLQLVGRARAEAQMTSEMRVSKGKRGSTFHYEEQSDMTDEHKIYGMFFSAFHENTWWWESTIAGRKIIIAMIGVFGATMGSMQVHLTLMLVVVILLITAQV